LSEGPRPDRPALAAPGRLSEDVERSALLSLPGGLPTPLFNGFDPSLANKLVTSSTASPTLIEQYRRLAATLHHAQLVSNVRSIMITSALPDDGKTLTATNLALTLSESYRRNVLLVDADLRRPALHDVFRVPNVSGLTEGLKATGAEPLNVLRITDTLTLLPAGRPEADPMGVLTSPRMRYALEEARSRFDWVVVDTAPVGLLADAGIVATLMDGALFVIRAGKTPYAAVNKAIDALGRDRVLGVVLNGAEISEDDNPYYRADVRSEGAGR
jgi:capsular exopolysaccharide synthesis family protein